MRTLLDPRRNPAFAIGHAGIDAESAVVHAERDAGLDDVIPEICHPPRMLCLSPAACLHLSHRPVRGRLPNVILSMAVYTVKFIPSDPHFRDFSSFCSW